MFPGFVTIYRDEEGFAHLYFFPGITDSDKFYYQKLDMDKCGFKFDRIKNEDKSREFIFKDKSVYGVECKLVKSKNNNDYIVEIVKTNE